MPDLEDGETTQIQGSGSSVYTIKNIAGAYSCSCPAWLHQSLPIERRTCKHIRAYRGDDAEKERLGTTELAGKPSSRKKSSGDGGEEESDESAPPILLAHKWETHIDVSGWWMSEKLDGVRAYWDGERFISRLGNAFVAPDWFVEGLPKTKLDGELWGGRKKFQRTVGIVKRQDKTDAWKEIRYVVFDAPDHGGLFEERIEHCREVLEGHAWASFHPHEVARDLAHVREELARVEGLGGEGLMMRKPRSKYEIGRSSTLLKVKTFHDAEARVLDHVAGAGRHKGRLGALLVELPNGTRFNVGTGFSDAEREDPPAIGSIITFRYQELSDGGVPRFPSYVGVRHDFAWPDASSARAAPVAKRPVVTVPVKLTSTPSKVRRFVMTDEEGTQYFWEIVRDGAKHRVRFGTFESKVKRFETEEEASEELERRIAEKIEKGFVEEED